MTQPHSAASTPHSVPLPDRLVRTIRTRSTALGVTVLVLSLAAVPTLLIAPYSLVPYADPLRLGVPLFAGITGCCLVGAGVFTLVARGSVADSHLRLNTMRVTRAGLLFAVVLSTISGLVAWGVLALVASTPPERYRDEVQFDTGEWLYVLLLFGAIALIWACFFALRPVLWRSRYVAREWIRWGA
ncbi:hypothetical protein [Haloechinothrix halophila]|uniref:hypothetical protein n=1 Tax=Haloechinothrix halophila TaxID=1069073 RepID=UPI0005535412|nr:hypothetical protein [Haloechinothrix halophila]